MAVPATLRWAARHGLMKVALGRAARRGEPDALLMWDQEACENPYPYYERLRARGGIHAGSVTHIAAGYEAVSAVLRDDDFLFGLNLGEMPRLLRGVLSAPPKAISPLDPPTLLAVNKPDHTRLRRQFAKVFTARAAVSLETMVQTIADELLDDLEGRVNDEIELMHAYAGLLPVTVVGDILGVPRDIRNQFMAWGNAGSATLDVGLSRRQFMTVERNVRAVNQWMYGHIGRLRKNPGDDLLSRLITVDDAEARMTDTELMAVAYLVLAAGFLTTEDILGSGIHLLLTNPSELELLRADPSLWPNAVEEILRYESPVQKTARWAGRDLEVCGEPIPRTTFVVTLIGSANRDPAVFPDPDLFDVTRANARDHLAFSAGVHFCLGAALARIEGRIGLSTLFDRYPSLSLAGPPVRRQTRTLRGLDRLPVRLKSGSS